MKNIQKYCIKGTDLKNKTLVGEDICICIKTWKPGQT